MTDILESVSHRAETERDNAATPAAEAAPQCAVCEAEVDEDDLNSNGACQDCERPCDHCGSETRTNDLTALDDWNDRAVCTRCLRHYRWSEIEGAYIPSEQAVRSEDTEDLVSLGYAQENWFCRGGSWYAEEYSNGGIFSCSESPLDHFQWRKENEPNALVFGVELEMESRNNSSADLVQALGGEVVGKEFILKEDGSLRDGVELVTMPLTLEQHRTSFGWEKILTPELAEVAKSGTDTTNCGMHVHVNRKAVSPLTVGKMLVFVNAPANARLITSIAQRSSNGYCARSAKRISDAKVRVGAERYEAINLSKHGTLEFRIFKGNLRPERVLKNIEFCHACVMFCRDASIKAVETPHAFKEFLSRERKTYPNLFAFLQQNDL